MKMKKIEYFPYLPNSQFEDNKRYKYIRDMMEKNPFAFHRKKNAFSLFDPKRFKIITSTNHNNNDEINYELNSSSNNFNKDGESLIFQKEHEKYMNLYNNFMKKKSSTIEANAQHYIDYISRLNKPFNNNNRNYSSNNNNNIPISPMNNSTLLDNFTTKSVEQINNNNIRTIKKSPTDINLLSYKASNSNINNMRDMTSNFIPNNIKAKKTDITNPFFYNGVAKEIIKLNQEVMEYNRKESENKFHNKKNKNSRYNNEYIPLSPEKIKNPNYYNLGDSSLEINPIINKGHYSMSFLGNHINFNKQKSDFY